MNIKHAMVSVVCLGLTVLLPNSAKAAYSSEGEVTILTLYSGSNLFEVNTTITDPPFCGGGAGIYIFDMNAANGKYILSALQAAQLSQRPVRFFYSKCVTLWGTSLPLVDSVQTN